MGGHSDAAPPHVPMASRPGGSQGPAQPVPRYRSPITSPQSGAGCCRSPLHRPPRAAPATGGTQAPSRPTGPGPSLTVTRSRRRRPLSSAASPTGSRRRATPHGPPHSFPASQSERASASPAATIGVLTGRLHRPSSPSARPQRCPPPTSPPLRPRLPPPAAAPPPSGGDAGADWPESATSSRARRPAAPPTWAPRRRRPPPPPSVPLLTAHARGWLERAGKGRRGWRVGRHFEGSSGVLPPHHSHRQAAGALRDLPRCQQWGCCGLRAAPPPERRALPSGGSVYGRHMDLYSSIE